MLSIRIRCAVSNAFYVHVVIIVSSDLHFNVDSLHWKITEGNFRFEFSERKNVLRSLLRIPACGLGRCWLQWWRDCNKDREDVARLIYLYLGKLPLPAGGSLTYIFSGVDIWMHYVNGVGGKNVASHRNVLYAAWNNGFENLVDVVDVQKN